MQGLKILPLIFLFLSGGAIAAQAPLKAGYTNVAVTQTPVVKPILLVQASPLEKYYIDVKHRFHGANYAIPPGTIKNIPLNQRIIKGGVVDLVKPKHLKLLDEYLVQNNTASDLLASYVARMVNYNAGYSVPLTNGKPQRFFKTTVYDAMLDELNYSFSSTPVHSLYAFKDQKQVEAHYLYILSRLDDTEKGLFWQFINNYKTGDNIVLPDGLNIADVLKTMNTTIVFSDGTKKVF